MRHQTETLDFLGLDPSMKGPFFASGLFHIILFIVTAVGIPFVAKDELIISQPLSVEIVSIDEITQTNKLAPPVKPEEKKEEPAPPKQQKPAPPQMTAEQPPDLTQPKAPEIDGQKAVPEEMTPPPEIAKEPEKAKPKQAPKKPEVTKKAEPKKTNDFQSLLKNLTPDVNKKSQDNTEAGEEASAEESQISRLADRLTVSEEDALRRQLAGCWNVMAGAKYAEELVVEIRVAVNRDRTVQQATILDQGRYNRDSHYRAAADAAMRALRNPRCSPLALPPGKYNEWKTTVIRFDPRDML